MRLINDKPIDGKEINGCQSVMQWYNALNTVTADSQAWHASTLCVSAAAPVRLTDCNFRVGLCSWFTMMIDTDCLLDFC